MRDRHKQTPVSLRFPEADRLWLAEWSRRTGQPVRRIVLAAVADYRAAHDPVAGQKDSPQP